MSKLVLQSERRGAEKPCFDVVALRHYTGRDGDERAAFTRIGAAWRRSRGGYRLRLDALPLGETIYLFERREHAPNAAADDAGATS